MSASTFCLASVQAFVVLVSILLFNDIPQNAGQLCHYKIVNSKYTRLDSLQALLGLLVSMQCTILLTSIDIFSVI